MQGKNFSLSKIDLQLQWIIADDWIYRQLLLILQNLEQKSQAIKVFKKLTKISKIKAMAAESQNFNLVMQIKDPACKSEILTILCESEIVAQILDQREKSDLFSLDGLISTWFTVLGSIFFLTFLNLFIFHTQFLILFSDT